MRLNKSKRIITARAICILALLYFNVKIKYASAEVNPTEGRYRYHLIRSLLAGAIVKSINKMKNISAESFLTLYLIKNINSSTKAEPSIIAII